jgi:hypothetical protein
MKKQPVQPRKLRLSRETLRELEDTRLQQVLGATFDPLNPVTCESGCLHCKTFEN